MGIDLSSRWVRFAAPYVLLVSSVVLAAQVTRDGRYYLAALLLSLPLGLVAVVGVYVVYGLAVQVVGALSSGLTSDAISMRTFAWTAPVNVLLFAGAAALNVLVLKTFLARHRLQGQQSWATPSPRAAGTEDSGA